MSELFAAERGRLDQILAAQVPGLSRRRAKKLIDAGAVFVDGKRCRVASRTLEPGARIVVHEPPEETEVRVPILYEDERVVAIDKPAGLHVNETETSAVRSIADRLRAKVVHRLDRDTTGVLVLAKDGDAAKALSEAFRDRRVEKHYVAVCVGTPEEGLIDAPIGPDPKRPRAQAIVASGKPARTEVRVLSAAGEVSAVALEIATGRTHQIRVHLESRGTPVLGDLMYGSPAAVRIGEAVIRPERMLLHAHRLNVEVLGRVLRLEAPLPDDFRALEAHGLAFMP